METGWLRKSQWIVHKNQNPDNFLDWETFKKVWSQWCNKDISLVLPEAKKIADKIERKTNEQTI